MFDETGQPIIFGATLQLENLDRTELKAILNSLGLIFTEYSQQTIQF